MDKVVTTNGQTIAVATYLPYREVGVGYLAARSNGGCTTMDGIHAVGVHVVRQTAGAADTRDDGDFMGRNADFGHGFMQ